MGMIKSRAVDDLAYAQCREVDGCKKASTADERHCEGVTNTDWLQVHEKGEISPPPPGSRTLENLKCVLFGEGLDLGQSRFQYIADFRCAHPSMAELGQTLDQNSKVLRIEVNYDDAHIVSSLVKQYGAGKLQTVLDQCSQRLYVASWTWLL